MFLGHERHQVEGGVMRELGGGPALFGHNLVQVDKVEVFVFLFASTSNNTGPVTDSIILCSLLAFQIRHGRFFLLAYKETLPHVSPVYS